MDVPVLYFAPLACPDPELAPLSRVIPLLASEMLHGTGRCAARCLMLYQRKENGRTYRRLTESLPGEELRELSGLSGTDSGFLVHGLLRGDGRHAAEIALEMQIMALDGRQDGKTGTLTLPAAEVQGFPGFLASWLARELLSAPGEMVDALRQPLSSSLEAFAAFAGGVDRLADPAADELARRAGQDDILGALELDPQFSRARDYLFARGLYLSRCRQTEAAVELFQKLLKGHHQDPRVFRAMAEAWIRADDFGRALPAMERAYALDPLDDELLLRLAWLAERLGADEDARDYYEQALERGIEETQLREKLGNLSLKLGMMEEAERHFERLVELSPSDGAACFGLAQARLAGGGARMELALESAREGIRREPEFWGNWWLLGQYLPEGGERDEAREKARQLNPLIDRRDEDQTAFQQAMGLAQAGKLDEAIDQLQALLERDPRFWEARLFLALVLREAGRAAEGIPQVRRALEIRPDHPELHNELTAALLEQKDYDGALDHAREACRLDPEHTGYRCNLGMSYLYKGEFAEAERQFLQARFRDPGAEQPENCLELLQELKRQEKAAEKRGVFDRLKDLLSPGA